MHDAVCLRGKSEGTKTYKNQGGHPTHVMWSGAFVKTTETAEVFIIIATNFGHFKR